MSVTPARCSPSWRALLYMRGQPSPDLWSPERVHLCKAVALWPGDDRGPANVPPFTRRNRFTEYLCAPPTRGHAGTLHVPPAGRERGNVICSVRVPRQVPAPGVVRPHLSQWGRAHAPRSGDSDSSRREHTFTAQLTPIGCTPSRGGNRLCGHGGGETTPSGLSAEGNHALRPRK